MLRITIKELHQTTGECVRRAGASKSPFVVTDHGKPVAILSSPSLFKPKRRQRTLLPEYEALMATAPKSDLMGDLNAVREDR
jgi:antitoxin (DNA-binding transcriptional repressor) of toxin-antitoxin stability system